MGGSGKKVEYEAKVDDEAFGGRYDAKKTFDNLEDAFKFLEKNKGIRSSNAVEGDIADGAHETNIGIVRILEGGKEVGHIVCSNGMPVEIDLDKRPIAKPEEKPAKDAEKPAMENVMAKETRANMIEGIKEYVMDKLAEPRVFEGVACMIGRDRGTGECWLDMQGRDEDDALVAAKMSLGKMPEAARKAVLDNYERLLAAAEKEKEEGFKNESMVEHYKGRRDEFSLPERPDDGPEAGPDKGADSGSDKK
jgi:hypothetical protein